MQDVFEILANATVMLSALLALAIIIRFNVLIYPLKLVGLYLIVSASIDVVSTAFFSVARSNLFFLHFFSFFEIAFLSSLFYVIFKILKSKLPIIYIAIPATILVVLNSLFVQNFDELNSYASILVSIVVLGYCIHYFLLILEVRNLHPQFSTLKVFIYCLFLFHSMSLGFMVFGGFLENLSIESETIIWTFRAFVIFATKVVLMVSFIRLFLKNSKLGIHERK